MVLFLPVFQLSKSVPVDCSTIATDKSFWPVCSDKNLIISLAWSCHNGLFFEIDACML